MFTCFYGNHVTTKRKESWNLLQALKLQENIPWLCVGNFNEILKQNEKFGVARRPYSQMESLRAILEACGLNDLGYLGDRFIWRNNREEGGDFTKERFDCALRNIVWLNLYENYIVNNLAANCSYHSPLLISLQAQHITKINERIFRYEASWVKRADCNIVIKKAWQVPISSSNRIQAATVGLKRCQMRLKQWSKDLYRGRGKLISTKLDMIKHL